MLDQQKLLAKQHFISDSLDTMVYPNGRCSLGDNCKAPTHDLAPRYKCYHCRVQLHPPACGCSVFFGEDEDGIISCHPDMAGTNCAARPKAAQPTVAQPTEAQPTEAELVAAQPPTVRPATVQQVGKRRKFSQTCLPVGGKRREKPPIAKKVKAGRKKGIPTTSNITRGQWYHACKTFRELKGVKMGQAEFLRGNRSDSIFTASGSQKHHFLIG